jgi:hypothetical protein
VHSAGLSLGKCFAQLPLYVSAVLHLGCGVLGPLHSCHIEVCSLRVAFQAVMCVFQQTLGRTGASFSAGLGMGLGGIGVLF